MAATPVSLESTTWYLAEGSSIKPVNQAIAKLRFSEGKVSGSTGCNNFMGRYTLEGNKLIIADTLATTRKACIGELGSQETLLLQAIPNIREFSINRQGDLEVTYQGKNKLETLAFIPESQFTPLHNSQWQLIRMAGSPPLADARTTPMVQFMGNRIAGTGGCNRFTGNFTVEGDRLIVDEKMASTMMACPEPQMQQEQAFTQALAAATTFAIEGDKLIINYTQGGKSQQLELMAPEVASRGVEKVVYVGPSQVDCVGVGPQKCLQVKEGSLDGTWQNYYGAIEGFTYEPGYTYKLRIREEAIANPPADASARRWTLIAVESKVPAATRALW